MLDECGAHVRDNVNGYYHFHLYIIQKTVLLMLFGNIKKHCSKIQFATTLLQNLYTCCRYNLKSKTVLAEISTYTTQEKDTIRETEMYLKKKERKKEINENTKTLLQQYKMCNENENNDRNDDMISFFKMYFI